MRSVITTVLLAAILVIVIMRFIAPDYTSGNDKVNNNLQRVITTPQNYASRQ